MKSPMHVDDAAHPMKLKGGNHSGAGKGTSQACHPTAGGTKGAGHGKTMDTAKK